MPDVFMPRLSDTMTEGILVQWLKREGDQVERGDALAEVETDKATMEVEAYDSGVLTRIIAEPGTTIPIGQPIAVIGDESPASDAPTPAATPSAAPPPAATSSAAPTPAAAPGPPEAAPREANRLPTSPLARSLARKHGLDLASIRGTGPGGRVVRADVQAAVAAQAAPAASATQTAPAAVSPAAPSEPARSAAAAEPAPATTADDERIPLTSIRRITAQRLTESAATPHFYLTSVADAVSLLALRADVNRSLTDSKVSVTDLLIRACAVTLRSHPDVNSSWAGDHLLRHAHVNVGCAVAIGDGLIVPVIRDADRKSLTEIATEAHALTERARAGKLTPDEFTGGTFTISNLGMYGIDHFTAVINPPEAAILAVGAARQEAVVRDGELVAATTMKLTLSIDHRVLDGATAAAFQRDLVDLLEHPLRIIV
ncbi:MAG TPA: dihydrolipoamide acetyltransferase family protein [Jatrophihabitantaceae bacterium]|jgi:pyruvate dehydrogenase E2 component (dihydrolipoamide acetyltransferase)